MPKIVANSITMHYQTRGSGEDVVLLHGVTSSLAMWYTSILPSIEKEFRTTMYDLRGHGLSDLTPKGYTSYDLSEDLRCLLDTLGIEKALLIGHSYGGAVATHFALRFPERVRGIVMLDTGFACLRYLRIIHKWRGWKRSNRLLPEVNLEQFLSIDTKQDVTEFLKTMLDVPRVAGFMKGKSGLTPRQRKLLEQTSIGFEFRDVAGMTEELLSTLQTPVLALYGETSPYQKMASHLAKILPNCRQEVVPGAGHFSIFTPGMVTDRIMPFLRDPISYNRESAVKYQNDSTSSTLSRLLRKLFSGRLWKNLTDR